MDILNAKPVEAALTKMYYRMTQDRLRISHIGLLLRDTVQVNFSQTDCFKVFSVCQNF